MSKILVVDDDPGILRLMEYTLTKEEYQVLTASNGIEGLKKAQEDAPDLIVLDVMLPGLDGFEVCNRLRKSPKTAQIPVMMLSAKGGAADIDISNKVGANKYLTKPVDRVELLGTVHELLARVEAADQTRARVAAFIGSRGGAGTSTVIASVSVVLSQMGYSVILVDLCSSYGSLNALMGLSPQHTIAELLKKPGSNISKDDLESVLSQHTSGVRLLICDQNPEDFNGVTAEGVEAVMQQMGSIADYILIDIPASPSGIVGETLKRCDFVNLITAYGPDTQARTGSAVSLLSRLGVDNKRIGVVIVDRSGMGLNEELSTSTSIDNTPIVGYIPSDARECADAEVRGIPLILASPLSPAAIALRALTEKLLSLEQLASSNKKGN